MSISQYWHKPVRAWRASHFPTKGPFKVYFVRLRFVPNKTQKNVLFRRAVLFFRPKLTSSKVTKQYSNEESRHRLFFLFSSFLSLLLFFLIFSFVSYNCDLFLIRRARKTSAISLLAFFLLKWMQISKLRFQNSGRICVSGFIFNPEYYSSKTLHS